MKMIKTLLVLFGCASLLTSFAPRAEPDPIAQKRPVEFQQSATESPIEAPAGFDNKTNGSITQTEFEIALATFVKQEEVDEGLGPVYNAQSCGECHQSPVTGGISQINELRAGSLDQRGNFVEAPGGSLINDRAIHPAIQERVPASATLVTTRTVLNTLGNGFVEAIPD